MLEAMIVVFGFMALGFVTQRKEEPNQSLATLCLYYLIPILIFQSFTHSQVSLSSLGRITLHFLLTTGIVYALLVIVIGKLFRWEEANQQLKWNSLAATLANVGYFGLAVVRYVFGEEAVPYAVAVALSFNVYMALFGFAQVGNVKDWSSRIKRTFRNPYLYAVALSLLWRESGLIIPSSVDQLLTLAANATLPLTLLLTGAELKRSRFHIGGLKEAAVVSLLKLFLPVVVAYPLAEWMADNTLEKTVMILMFGMPTSLNLLLLAKEQERDTTNLAMVIILTTVACPFTLIGLLHILGAK